MTIDPIALLIAFLFGAVIGAAYFAILFFTTSLYLSSKGSSPLLIVLILARLVLIIGSLVLLIPPSTHSIFPIFAWFIGFITVRTISIIYTSQDDDKSGRPS